MKKFLKYTILILVLAIGGLCIYIYNLEKIRIHVKPNEDNTFYTPDTTEFAIPMSLSVKDVEKLANLKLKQVLFDGKLPVRKEKDTLHLKVKRAGNIRFNLLNNVLTAHVPLDAEAFYTLHTIGKNSRTFFQESPVVFSLEISLSTPLKLNDYYGFNPRTSIKNIQWKIPPVVKLGPLKKDISEQTEELLYKKEDLLTAKLDSIISEKISLREPMEKIWGKIQRSVPLKLDSGKITLYLRKQPLSASVWVEPNNVDSLHFMMRLKGLLYMLSARDTLRFKQVDLPKKLIVLKQKPVDDTSRFHLHVSLPLHMLEAICNARLEGKTLSYASYTVKLKRIRIANGEKNILISLKYKGDLSGEVRLKGFPKLDVSKKIFNVNDLEFESRDDDLVLGSAEKVFHNDIREKIKEAVLIDMTKIMDTIPSIIQNGIDKSKLAKKADVELNCFELKQVKTTLTTKYVQLMVDGCAQIRMDIKKDAIIKKPGTGD